MKWKIEQQSVNTHVLYARPDQLCLLPNAREDDVKALKALIKSRPKKGARFVYAGKGVEGADVKSPSIDPRAGFAYIVDHILNQNYLGLERPPAKALTTPGFTEASIRGAIELHELVVFMTQHFIKWEVEKLWRFVVEVGYDPIMAPVRLNWGPPGAPDMEQLSTLMPHFIFHFYFCILMRSLINLNFMWPKSY